MTSCEKRDQSSHIYDCYGIRRARTLGILPSHLEYCYNCTDWYVRGRELDEHYKTHLSTLLKNCGAITYRHTLIKPAYCLFHLAATDLLLSQRLRSWSRDADCLAHIKDEHLREVSWPLACPLGCEADSKDEESFFYHLSDCHGYTIPTITRKRKRRDDDVVDAKKHKVGSEYGTDDELPPLDILPAKIEQGTDPTLPIVLDDDDPVWPLIDVELAAPQPFVGAYRSPKEEAPIFFRLVSLCSTTDDELERPGETGCDSIDTDPFEEFCISDWVNLRQSPPPDAGIKTLGLGSADLPYLVAHRTKLPPSPLPPAMDERHACPSLCSTPETTEVSSPDKPEGGIDSASDWRVKSKGSRIQLNLNYTRPKIVLRLPLTPPSGRKAGRQPGRPRKRRRKA